MTELVIQPDTASDLTTALGSDFSNALGFAQAEKASSTRKAYASDFGIFRSWCERKGVAALPASAETVAAFLASEAAAGVRPSTISRRVASIRYAHKLASLDVPTDAEGVKATVRGIRRTFGTARIKKTPALAAKILAMVASAPDSLAGLRDRALLLLGFAGAFRRSELVALNVEDIEQVDAGLRIVIRHGKTDQESSGATIAIPRGDVACPVHAVLAWLKAAQIETGPILRAVNKVGTVSRSRLSDRSVANIIKAYATDAGFDAASFSGHSLRSGFLTSAAANGASIFKLMDVSRHRSVETLRGYVRDAELFKNHAGSGLL